MQRIFAVDGATTRRDNEWLFDQCTKVDPSGQIGQRCGVRLWKGSDPGGSAEYQRAAVVRGIHDDSNIDCIILEPARDIIIVAFEKHNANVRMASLESAQQWRDQDCTNRGRTCELDSVHVRGPRLLTEPPDSLEFGDHRSRVTNHSFSSGRKHHTTAGAHQQLNAKSFL
jgi:hypothetical protein